MFYKNYLLSGVAVFSALMCLSEQAAQAQVSRIYLAGYLGLNTYGTQEFENNSTTVSGDFEQNNAVSFAGALGLRLSKQVRLEGEVSYRKPEFKHVNLDNGGGSFTVGGGMKQWSGLLNVYYDFDTRWKFTPYVSAGAGVSYFQGDLDGNSGQNFTDSAFGLTYQAGAGLKYRPRSNVAYTMGYRYLDTLALDMGDMDIDYSSHEFRVGLEYDLDWGRKKY
ncbi:MAG: hypothetical protein CMH27_09905 [Micavibrio sp.]|nr:hypothetical protein [Micavibrio sp.]|tara:strand:+ start:5547 stop:6209 length:663 start_codon:yes stop_codon:yes gene_type:complete